MSAGKMDFIFQPVFLHEMSIYAEWRLKVTSVV